jgi:hypothetical protein
MTSVYFDPAWLVNVNPLDWQCLTRNLLTASDDPVRADPQLRLNRIHCNTVVDLHDSLRLVPLAQADAILLPICHKVAYYGAGSAESFARACREAEHLSRRTGLPVVVQGASADLSDLVGEMRLPLSNFLYFNAAIIDTGPAERLHSHVYFVQDYLQKYFDGRVDPIETTGSPTVSFWGVCAPFAQRWSTTRVADYARYALSHLDSIGVDSERIVRRFGTNMKHAHRARVVSSIRACSKIQFDLRLQPVGGLVDGRFWLETDQSEYRRGFYNSIHRSLYSVCCRGTENYSIRFYETLCLGRIPVVVDTDIRLPLEEVIDYEKHCLIIPKPKAGRAAQLILEHYQRLSSEQLRQQQLANRRLWQTHLSPASFYGQPQPLLRRFRRPPHDVGTSESG